jgi:hypothetical protein
MARCGGIKPRKQQKDKKKPPTKVGGPSLGGNAHKGRRQNLPHRNNMTLHRTIGKRVFHKIDHLVKN